MMRKYPQLWELIGVFETEPSAEPGWDSEAPWWYDTTITFRTDRDRDQVECSIDIGCGRMDLRWWRDGIVQAELGLGEIDELQVKTDGGVDALQFSYEATGGRELSVVFQLRPRIQIAVHV